MQKIPNQRSASTTDAIDQSNTQTAAPDDAPIGQQLWHSWLLSLQFLTRLPVHRFTRQANAVPSSWSLGQALNFYSLVGLKIGSILWMTACVLSWAVTYELIQLNTQVIAGVLLMLWVLLTGGLHRDGLADSADAWMGGLGDRDKTLAIMKDPACGVIAVIVLILVLLLKWLLLDQIVQLGYWHYLLLVPAMARLGVMSLVIYTPYQRTQGLGSEIKQHSRGVWFWLQFVVFVAMLAVLQWWEAAMALLLALVFGLFLRRLMMVRLGGWTGDTAGAYIELVELTLLLVMVALA